MLGLANMSGTWDNWGPMYTDPYKVSDYLPTTS